MKKVRNTLVSSWVWLVLAIVILVIIVIWIMDKTMKDANAAITSLNKSGAPAAPPTLVIKPPSVPAAPPAPYDPSTGALPVTDNDAQMVLLDPNATQAQRDAANAILNSEEATQSYGDQGFPM